MALVVFPAVVILSSGFLLPCREPGYILEKRRPVSSAPDSIRPALADFFGSLHREIRFSGVVRISQADKVLFTSGYGFADDGRKLSNNERTPFLLASVTKQFTGMAIERLRRDGRISRAETLSRFLPELASTPWGQVCIQELLDHRAGLPRYFPPSTFLKALVHPRTLYSESEALLEFRRFHPMQNNRGQFHYSDLGYQLLRIVISRASGVSWDRFLRREVFGPAGLGSTRIRYPGDSSPCRGYVMLTAMLMPQHIYRILVPSWNYSLFYGAVGIESNLTDLANWDRFLRTTEKGYLAELASRYMPQAGENYSSGFSFVQRADGQPVIRHDGFEPGHYAGYYRFPRRDLSVLILSNSTPPRPPSTGGYNPVAQLLDLLSGQEYLVLR